jgi:glycosyltransferase involved in cell wall biosynthesis
MTARPRILDIVNTDHAALNFLANRVAWVNRHTEFRNEVICSPGPHLPRIGLPPGIVTALDIPRDLSPRGLSKLFASLVRRLRAESYTIVHTHNSITGAVGRMAARLARVPLVVHTVHGFHFHEAMSPLERAPWVAIERWLARRSDLVLCQSHEEVAESRRLGLRPRQGVYHVGNGIDLRQFHPRPRARENPRPVLLCVGRLEAVKNQTMLFRALRLLRPQHAPLLQLVGDGPLRDEYERELARLGLADSVEFLGYRYDIPELTAAADVAVLTSVKEGIPRAVMQAMAVGVPVVATDVKGTRELIADGETGFLVPLGDASAFAERVRLLLESPARRREMGSRAADHARLHFDEERIVERLVRLYRLGLRGRGLAPVLETPLGGSAPAERGAA